jgi:polysaccharide pyruvyl transferase WcaK-like protein
MELAEAKIGLLNHIGGGNLGDDATLDVVIRNIRRRWPHAVITAFSINPDDTTTRHGIPSYPIRTRTWSFGYKPARPDATFKENVKTLAGKYKVLFVFLRALHTLAIRMPRALCRELWFLAKSRRLLKTFDLLIISGGGQLTEKDGPWAFPYTIFKWVALAKSARVRCVVLNVGAGPLSHPLSKYFVTRALRAADYVSFRDGQSQALAHEIGFTGASEVFPDSVYSLEASTPNTSFLERRGQLIVGIAPIPYCDPRVDTAKQNQTVYDDFIGKCAIFASGLVKHSYLLALFGTDIGVDPLAIADLRTALRNHHDVSTSGYKSINSIQELLSSMSLMDYVVTCRFHGVIFAHLLNKPVLAVSPHPKVTNLMADLGLQKYCVDIRRFDPKLLADTFASLVSNTDQIKSCMAASLTRYKSQLTGQFDGLFPRVKTSMHEESVVKCGVTSSNGKDLVAEWSGERSDPHV